MQTEGLTWIERLKASPLGRAEYRVKCWLRELASPLQRWSDERIIRQLPAKMKVLERKPQIKVLFFAMHPAYWRCDGLYQLMLDHPRFDPVILVCGSKEHGVAAMRNDVVTMRRYLNERGFAYRTALDETTGQWLDIRKDIDPDILIYVKPYTGLLPRAYEFDRFLDKLFIHLPYGIHTTNLPELCDTRYCRLSWMQFHDSELVFQDSPIQRRNTRLTGSTRADQFMEHAGHPQSPWKVSEENVGAKRVIWAPHHSINGGSLGYSNFLEIADDFLQLACQLKGQVQFAFKPHPLLRQELYANKEWGKERADRYYCAWAEEPNLQLEEGDYIDLFLTSDAMVHDCGSFTAEYLMVNKPVMYVAKAHHEGSLNGFGKAVFAMHYQGSSMADITHFLHDVVLQGHDPMAQQRTEFCQRNLLPPGGRTAAENMLQEILKFQP